MFALFKIAHFTPVNFRETPGLQLDGDDVPEQTKSWIRLEGWRDPRAVDKAKWS